MNADWLAERYWRAVAALSMLIMQGAALIIFFGLGIVGYQCVLWLRDGYWTPLPVSVYVPEDPTIDWSHALGVKRLVDALYDVPSSVAVVCAGAAVLVLGVWLMVMAEADANRRAAAIRKKTFESNRL